MIKFGVPERSSFIAFDHYLTEFKNVCLPLVLKTNELSFIMLFMLNFIFIFFVHCLLWQLVVLSETMNFPLSVSPGKEMGDSTRQRKKSPTLAVIPRGGGGGGVTPINLG